MQERFFTQKDNLIKHFQIVATHKERKCFICKNEIIPYNPYILKTTYEDRRWKQTETFCFSCMEKYLKSFNNFYLP